MTRVWRALVVDDEPPARALLASYVQDHRQLALVGQCSDGDEAVAAISTMRPDIVFLDIQMPGRSGFEVIDSIGVERMPLVVFITAYDDHALRAFRAHAFHYLLKPIDRAEFDATVDRAGRRLAADAEERARPAELERRLDELMAALRHDRLAAERLTVWSDGRAAVILTRDIDRAEVEGNYVRLHVGSSQHVMRVTMSALEERLSSRQFIRLNRSTLVNVDFIRELQTYLHGDYAVILRDGSSVITGPTYRDRIRERFRS